MGEQVPAVLQLCPHVFQVCVSHVIDFEDIDVRVLGEAFLDVGVEAKG